MTRLNNYCIVSKVIDDRNSVSCILSSLSMLQLINCWLTKLIFLLQTFSFSPNSLLVCLEAFIQSHIPLDLNFLVFEVSVCPSHCYMTGPHPAPWLTQSRCSANISCKNKWTDEWTEALEAQRRTTNRLDVIVRLDIINHSVNQQNMLVRLTVC